MDKHVRLLFAGGGTAGPVTPLLAVMDECVKRFPGAELHWVGTPDGPERPLLAQKHVAFTALRAAKIDRFFSARNLIAPFVFVASCVSAWRLLRRVKPDVVVAAGAFVAVPVVMMAKMMRVPALIHQLDVRPGLANKIMAPFASTITVTFESSLKDFSQRKTVWTGAPVRQEILQPKTVNAIPTKPGKPVLLVFGGGTGAQAINDLVARSLDELTQTAQVIHITGKGKRGGEARQDYYPYEFLAVEMAEAYAKADLVVTRAGLGTMLELAALQKPAIVIPIPNSHQEDNAVLLAKTGSALILDQNRMSPQEFASAVTKLLKDGPGKARLAGNISRFYRPDAAAKIVEKISQMVYADASNSKP